MSQTAVVERPDVQPTSPLPMLTVRDLEVRFFSQRGVVHAVNQVSFTLERGERMAIVGESGSGKSVMTMSLLKLVSHPGKITGGEVLFGGTDVTKLSEKELNNIRGAKIAMVFQDPMTSLNPVMRIEDQVCAPMMRHLKLSRAEARARGIELLAQVGIPAPELRITAYPHELSGGMRQRVLIAIALSCKPDLILADEPTTALDVTIQAQIIVMLKRLAEENGNSVIFVTHDLGLVARFAQKVAVMYAGRIVELGPVKDIYANPQHPYTQGLLASIPTVSGEKIERLTQIPGAPPDMRALGDGCSFAARCAYVTDRCLKERPQLLIRKPGHSAACFVDIETAPKTREEAPVGTGN